jgi:hypothetical protein
MGKALNETTDMLLLSHLKEWVSFGTFPKEPLVFPHFALHDWKFPFILFRSLSGAGNFPPKFIFCLINSFIRWSDSLSWLKGRKHWNLVLAQYTVLD